LSEEGRRSRVFLRCPPTGKTIIPGSEQFYIVSKIEKWFKNYQYPLHATSPTFMESIRFSQTNTEF